MALWNSMKQRASKLAFDAEKAMRIKREESVVSSLRTQIDAQSTALGKTVLTLAAEGTINHPQVEPFVEQVAQLQEEIRALEAKIALIKAEEFTGDVPEEETVPTVEVPPIEPPLESPPPPAAPMATIPPPSPGPPAEDPTKGGDWGAGSDVRPDED